MSELTLPHSTSRIQTVPQVYLILTEKERYYSFERTASIDRIETWRTLQANLADARTHR